jgi:hypothetical protein
MKIPPGMVGTTTHNLIIADRSEAGMFAVATIMDVCSAVDDRIGAWRNSTDRFILFILDRRSDSIRSVAARDLEHLLAEVLPELYSDRLKPPVNVALDILVEEPDVDTIDDRIAQLLIAVALEAGLQQ